MKNFSDLLAIDPALEILVIDDQTQKVLEWPLLEPLDLTIDHARSVQVDGMEIINFGYFQGHQWMIHHDRPFYQWQHEVTGQGWLLHPIKI